MGKHIIHEAKRCLGCKKPLCVEGCPVNTDIPQMIEMLLEGNILEAGDMVFKNNPLSLVCSLVCSHERQCEGNCVLNHKKNPIQISSIEHYISDYSIETLKLNPIESKDGNVGIIGSGPAGITIAFLLAVQGYHITVFESNEKIGGVLRYGIPEFRLPKRILDRLKEKLLELGVVIRPNILIGPGLTIDELFRDGFDAIFIGTGVWKPNKLNIKGETLGHVHFAIDYLRDPSVYDIGEKVVVIGAGNVAMDVARTLLRNGAKSAHIMYRRGMDDMPAREYEIDYAKIDGVLFETHKTPFEFTREGVMYSKTKYIDGKLVTIPDTENLFECDSIIIAASQGPKSNIVANAEGIDVDDRGLVLTGKKGETTREGIYASGDVVTGARTVVEAVKYSKNVAEEIARYIEQKKAT